MLKYSQEVIKFEIDGEKHEVAFPKAKDQRRYEEDIMRMVKGEDDKSFFDIQKEYIIKLGLKEEVYDELQQKQIFDLLEYLNGQKKISN